MSLSALHPFNKRHHGCVHLLLCLHPMWQLRSCHSTSKLSHLCYCVIQVCHNNIICASCPSLAIAHMFINIESSNRFVPEQTKNHICLNWFPTSLCKRCACFRWWTGLWAAGGKTSPDGTKALCGLCGLLVGSERSLQRCLGYVLRARLLNLQFLKTAFFSNEPQPSEICFNRFRFFSRLWYITLNNKVLCGLMGRK